ncbi:MAG: tetratricopeptide repeat protein [Inhella sp.]
MKSALVFVLLSVQLSLAAAQVSWNCGPLENGYGPYDYRKERTGKLPIVDGAHFTPEVETLIRGHTAVHPGGDIDYTLRASPNHHRALAAMARLTERGDGIQPRNMRYSADCWFLRGIRFAADDPVVRLLYAQHLMRVKRPADAIKQLQGLEALQPPEALTWINLALLYAELGRFEEARNCAERARTLGLEREALTARLAGEGFPLRAPEAASAVAPAASDRP